MLKYMIFRTQITQMCAALIPLLRRGVAIATGWFFLTLPLPAQTISNIKLSYHPCPCLLTVTYDLNNATQPTDVLFYYSTDSTGYSSPGTTVGNWLYGTTFEAQSPGTNTGTWDCYAAGVAYSS